MTILEQNFAQIGHSARRNDGLEKVTGQARFAADLRIPGTLHARLILSPYAHARIVKIDKEAALKVPGVVKVVTAQDLPLKPEASATRARNPLAEGEVVFYGQPVAVVLGESEAAALDGVAAVQIQYEPLPVVNDILEAIKPDALTAHKQAIPASAENSQSKEESQSPNIVNQVQFKEGDIEQGFKEADLIIENTYRLPMVHQSYIETQSCLVVPEPLGAVTVYSSTQTLFGTRKLVAEALGLPLKKIKVVIPPVGGGFGAKASGVLEPLCAALAILSKRPVALSYYRMEDLAAANPAPDCVIEIKLGAKQDGTLVALQTRLIFNTGAYPNGSPYWMAAFYMTLRYRVPNYKVDGFEVMTNRVGAGSYRAPGLPQYAFAVESQIDLLAEKLGLNPIELRLKNTPEWDKSLPEVLKRLEESSLWQQKLTKQREQYEGFGFAAGALSATRGPASAMCRMDQDGTFTITSGLADISGASTSLALIAAEVLGTNATSINMLEVDSDSAPHVGATGGSQTIYTLGLAVKKAAEDVSEQLKQIAGERLEANPLDLELRDGKVQVKGIPSRSISFEEIAQITTTDYEGKYPPVFGRGNSSQSKHASGGFAHLAHVKVDPETGEVEILDYLAIHDVGFAINPAEVEGQIHGGVSQGLGWALYEQLVYDENGTLLSGSLMDYALQTAPLVPHIQVELVQVASEDGPFGAKGVGEPPIVPGGAAIANAIYDAVGVRLTELPATPQRVLSAINSKSV